MGGRGSYSISSGHRENESISSLEATKKSLGDKMFRLSRTTDSNGQMTSQARREYYSVKSQRDEIVSKLSAAYKQEAERKKESAASGKSKKTFVNSFGEATKREITSATYERARRRRERQAQSVFMGR